MEGFKKRALLRCQRFPVNGSYEKLTNTARTAVGVATRPRALTNTAVSCFQPATNYYFFCFSNLNVQKFTKNKGNA